MPIHDQGYRRYEGTRAAAGGAWWVIARMHIAGALRRRLFVGILLAGWVQFFGRVGAMVFSAMFGQVPQLATTADTFRSFLGFQVFFVFLIVIAMGGLVADDRRANALQLYLSRPLTRTEYIVGKVVPLLVFILGVTFVPAIALLVMQVIVAGSLRFVLDNLFLLPAITLATLAQALLSSFAILALSSLSTSRRFVSIMYAGIVFFTAAIYQVLRGITGSRAWAVISPGEMIDVIVDAMFRVRSSPPVPVYVAALVVIGLIALSIWVLDRRVRAVEVVA